MKFIRKFYQSRLINLNIEPYKVKILESGAIKQYYLNGKITIKPCKKYTPEACGEYIATSFVDICPTCKTGI